MKVLSLFDGMACGMIAMQLAGVEVESYDAYEIDKYAIKAAQHNFPMIKEHGDVFGADFTQYEGVDFLIGGSPCTYWSIAQMKNRETVASGMGWELFSQYVRALHEAKPKYFIYENNKSMSKAIRASIDETFCFEAVLINSALVSAQNRQRLYWVGRRNADGTYSKVNVEQPADRGILLKDVIDNAVAMRDKAHTIDANYYKGGNFTSPNKQSGKRLMAAEPINTDANEKAFCVTSRYYKGFGNNPGKCLEKHRDSMVAEPVACRCRGRVDASGNGYAKYECREDGKSNTLDTNTTNWAMVAEPINVTVDDKSHTLKAQYYKNGIANFISNDGFDATAVAEPVCVAERGRMYCGQPQHYEARTDGKTNTLTYVEKDNRVAEPVRCMQYELKEAYVRDSGCVARLDMPKCHDILTRVYRWNGKCPTLTAHGGGNTEPKVFDCYSVCFNYSIEFDDDGKPIKAIGKDGKEITIYEVRDGKITIKGKQYPIKLKDGFYIIRKLTVSECKQLQTVPEWYEFPVSDSQAYKILGNGWTCEVIAHILKSLKEA